MKSPMLKAALALAMATPLMASAESQLATGSASAQARLELFVTIPRVVFLAVGTSGAGLQDNPTVDVLNFDYSTTAQTVGNGTASAPQSVTVRVFGNDGQVTLATDPAVTQLVDATSSDAIPLTKISASSSDANLPVPAFGGGSVTVAPTSGRVTDRTADWSFVYANDIAPASGIYQAIVTYTASLP